jgi:hypothetical protein
VSLDYAAEHLTAAVRALGTSEAPLQQRLQTAWDDHVQNVWEKPCLTSELLREFRDLWQRYTAPSDDRQSTILRTLEHDELAAAVGELIALTIRTAVAADRGPDTRLATLADL